MNEIMSYFDNEYIRYETREKKSIERTLKKYRSCIKEFTEYMRVDSIDELNKLRWPEVRENWIRVKESEGLSNSSLNLRISSLRSFLGYLNAMGYIDENIANDIKKFKCKPRKDVIDVDKIKLMLDLVNKDYNENPCYKTARDRMMLHLLMFTTLRNEELRDLTIYNIGLDGRFSVEGKFSKTRNLYIPDKLIKMYQEYLMWYRSKLDTDSEYLFVSCKGKGQLDKNVPLNLVKYYANQVGLSWVCHTTRKASITMLIDSNIPIEQVATIAGHTSTNTTLNSYYQSRPETIKDNINKNKLLDII